MRIVAGRHRGRPLEAPEGLGVRPTADRTREALFNILSHGALSAGGSLLAGAEVLDAFAGSGALGLEALSRGAGEVTFLEAQPAALAAIRKNLRNLGEEANARVLQADVLRPPPARAPAQLVLLDPPYNQGLAQPALAALLAAGWIGPGSLIAVELMKDEAFTPPSGLETLDERRYGKARLVFLHTSD